MQAAGEVREDATKAAVHMGRRPQEKQGSDEQATMETDEHDTVFRQLNVSVQQLGHMVQHILLLSCRSHDASFSACFKLISQLASVDSLDEA